MRATSDTNGNSGATANRKASGDKGATKVLNIDALDQSMWLVKVPAFVAERWATAENDEILGTLSVSMKSAGPGKPPAKQLNINLSGHGNSDGPDAFTLEELKSSTDNFIAISSNSNGGFSVDGKITKNMVLKPQINEEYRKLIRDRGLSNVANRREIGIANMKQIEMTSTQSHTVEFITSDRMELKRKAAAEKALLASKAPRTAGAEEGDMLALLRGRVFEAFEKNDRLTLKEIESYCKTVPGFSNQADLRDLLEQYAKYNHRGTYKHFWELKAEYRDHYTEPKAEV